MSRPFRGVDGGHGKRAPLIAFVSAGPRLFPSRLSSPRIGRGADPGAPSSKRSSEAPNSSPPSPPCRPRNWRRSGQWRTSTDTRRHSFPIRNRCCLLHFPKTSPNSSQSPRASTDNLLRGESGALGGCSRQSSCLGKKGVGRSRQSHSPCGRRCGLRRRILPALARLVRQPQRPQSRRLLAHCERISFVLSPHLSAPPRVAFLFS